MQYTFYGKVESNCKYKRVFRYFYCRGRYNTSMTSENANNTREKLLAAAAVLIVVTLLVLGAKALAPKQSAVAQQIAQNGVANIENAPSAATTTSLYKDGTYSATGTYDSPGGFQRIGVSVTLSGNKIVSASVTPEANDGDSREYQDMFISGYQQYVVGRDVGSLHLSRISGASLATEGFNNALRQIKSKAQS
jgi:uncharacterized protein with FMN-binding domain